MGKRRSLNPGIGMVLVLLLFAAWLFPQTAQADVLEKYTNGKIYDVTVYGADRSGAVNSDAAVQTALQTARTDIRKGYMDGKERAVIYFPAGSYKVSLPMRLYTGMCIAAEDGTTVQCGRDYGIQMYTSQGCRDYGIQMYTSQGCSVEGGTWTASGEGSIIYASRAENLDIRNVSVQNGKTGIAAYQSTVNMENVSASQCRNEGFCFSNNAKVTANNCKVLRNGSGYPAKNFLGHGIGVYGGAELIVSNSQLSYNVTGGVSLQEGKMTADHVQIRDNGYVGVGTSKKCSLTMNNCDVYHNGYKVSGNQNGVSIVEGSYGKFTNCKIRSNKVTGILISGASKAYMKGCTFKGNGAHNIYVDNMGSGKASCTINGCSFYKCRHASVGFYVKKKTSCSVTIKGKNKYYVKPNYTYWANGIIYAQK